MTNNNRRRNALLLTLVAVLAAGAGALAYTLISAAADPPPGQPNTAGQTAAAGQTSPAGEAPTPPARLRVADLMDRAGCKGSVIGTQLYSYETGRCTLDGGEVTIAVFDTNKLRDQWVEFAREYGGTFVIGDGWAAMVDGPDAAGNLADNLDGTVT